MLLKLVPKLILKDEILDFAPELIKPKKAFEEIPQSNRSISSSEKIAFIGGWLSMFFILNGVVQFIVEFIFHLKEKLRVILNVEA